MCYKDHLVVMELVIMYFLSSEKKDFEIQIAAVDLNGSRSKLVKSYNHCSELEKPAC